MSALRCCRLILRGGLAAMTAVGCLVLAPLHAADVIISELHAYGTDDFLDGEGDRVDWLELQNQSAATIDLRGWALSDQPDHASVWVFPSHTLAPGAALIVFASGKDRGDGELHTNFRLSSDGEYLALLRPDGAVEHAYAPEYPEQRYDLSYGVRQEGARRRLVSPGDPARVLVPDGPLPADWVEPAFADTAPGWFDATTPLGFDRSGAYGQLVAGDVEAALYGKSSTLLARFSFDVEAPASLAYLSLTVSADDGFVAYLNGREVARANAPKALDSTSRATRPGAAVQVTPGEFGVLYQETFSNDTGQIQPLEFAGWSWISDLGAEAPHDRAHVSSVGAGFVAEEGSVNSFPRAGDSQTGYLYAGYFSPEGPHQDALLYTEERPLDPADHPGIQFRWSGHSPGEPARVALRVAGSWFVSERTLVKEDGFATFTDPFVVAEEAWRAVDFVPGERFRPEGPTPLPSGRFEAFGVFFEGLADDASNARIKNFRVDGTAAPRRDLVPAHFDLSAHTDALREGRNVLAFHALNAAPDDGDFFLLPELVAGTGVDVDAEESGVLAYFVEPTPGELNGGPTFPGLTGDTRFSVDRGFYEEPFEVALSVRGGGDARIVYTTDGRLPRVDVASAAVVGELYDGPIRVAATTTLRALAVRPGYAPSNVDTQTYVFLADVLAQSAAGRSPTWGSFPPSTSINGTPWTIGDPVPSDWEMDPGIVDDSRYTDDLIAGLTSIPSISLVLDEEDLFGEEDGIYVHPLREGMEWERPASLEFFDSDGRAFQINAGLRIHGGASRRPDQSRKHSFRIKFRAIYDGNAQLNFPLFREAPFGEGAVQSFDTLVLRASYSDGFAPGRLRWTPINLRDQWARDAQLAIGGAAAHGLFVQVYLNGLYWGLYNLTERIDGAFGAAYYGGDKDAYDLIKDGGVDEGDNEAWAEALSLAARSIATDEGVDALAALVDLDDLDRSMLVQLHAGNWDWPSHNWHALRPRTGDGLFRFPIWDAEASMGSNGPRDATVDVTTVTDGPARFFSRLRGSDAYRLRFADLLQKTLIGDGPLAPERAAALFERRVDEIRDPIVAETARWGDHEGNGVPDETLPYTRDGEWKEEIDWLLGTWFPGRSRTLLEQFRLRGLYPALEAPRFAPRGGRLAVGEPIALTAPLGVVYYTRDGTDPRLADGSVSPAAHRAGPDTLARFLGPGAPARVFVPRDASLGVDWTALDFDDSRWIEAVTGVGFEGARGLESEIETDIGDLALRVNSTVYLRLEFEADLLAEVAWLNLRMKYDDGYAAYLNGVLIAARNAPEQLTWDARARRVRQDAVAVQFESVDVNEHIAALRPGRNVLAIHALNSSVSSNDMLILPELLAGIQTEPSRILVDGPVTLRARAWFEGKWSALEEQSFAVGSSGLRVTEVMYNPPPLVDGQGFDNDDFEYVELMQTGTDSLRLAGTRLTGGVEFVFDEAAGTLAPRERILLVRDLEAFALRYEAAALSVAGEYDGALRNSGEALRLVDSFGETILEFTYDDGWFPSTDGGGAALEIIDPDAPVESWSEATSWRASDVLGTPGGGNPPAAGGQRIGDASQDGRVNILDAIRLLERLFDRRDDPLPCPGGTLGQGGNLFLHDVNADGRVNVADSVSLLDYLFRKGTPPAGEGACVEIEGCPAECVR